jgi:hypothetical protein
METEKHLSIMRERNSVTCECGCRNSGIFPNVSLEIQSKVVVCDCGCSIDMRCMLEHEKTMTHINLKKARTKVVCECGYEIERCYLSTHEMTSTHFAKMKEISINKMKLRLNNMCEKSNEISSEYGRLMDSYEEKTRIDFQTYIGKKLYEPSLKYWDV